MLAFQQTPPPRLCPLSVSVFDVLGRHTSFPWPVMKSQCAKGGIDPHSLTATTLGAVLQDLSLAVARFNDMNAGLAVRRDLVGLLRAETHGLR